MAVDIKLARERWDQAESAESKQRQRELDDISFYNGNQWAKDILDARQGQTIKSGVNSQVIPARPSIVVNRCLEPVSQVLNAERQSDLTVELIPADDFVETAGPIDHSEIELREGLVRRIQRDSEAADARTWAFNRATIAGRGYWAINTRFVPKSFDQEVYEERLYNQAGVLLDPAHEQPDGSDSEWGFVGSDYPIDVYDAKWPKRKKKISAQTTDEEWRALGDQAPNWFVTTGKTRSVRVVRYYYAEHHPRELVALVDGRNVWREKITPQDVIATDEDGEEISRWDDEKQWYWADIDGVQELDSDRWPGRYCPIIKVLGEELQPYDNERRAQGIVRPMRGPCEGNNYIISKFVEQVGLTPIPPWLGPAGFDEGYENEYDAANTRALGRLHYNTKALDGTPIGPGAVMRTPVSTDVQHLAFGVQVFSQAIVSTSKTPETALGNVDPSVKSGKLAKALIAQAEQGTSNFLDNLKRSMRHEARIVNDLLYPIYGTRPGRLARMMNSQGEMSAVVIGQPFTVQGQGPQAKPQPIQAQPGQPLPQGAKEYKLTPDAEFNVAVKISKNEGTRREQEVQTLAEMISADPTLMQVLGDLFFKYQDGPGHQEMSERMKAVLIPPVQALVSGKPSIPPELQQQMAQMQEQMQQLSELADKNKTDLIKAQMQEQGEMQRAALKSQADERQAALDNLVKLAIAEISAQASQAATDAEQARTELGFANQHHSETNDRTHEAIQAHQDRAHEAVQNALDRDHEATQAALEPEPVAE